MTWLIFIEKKMLIEIGIWLSLYIYKENLQSFMVYGDRYKNTDERFIEWQRVTASGTTNDSEWYNEWQRVTANENEWQRVVQRVTKNDNKWQRVTKSGTTSKSGTFTSKKKKMDYCNSFYKENTYTTSRDEWLILESLNRLPLTSTKKVADLNK